MRLSAAAGFAGTAKSYAQSAEVENDAYAIAWHNWSGRLSATPTDIWSPESVDELAASMNLMPPPIRVVGAGHSFSPLVPTDGVIVTLDRMSGLISYDEERQTARFHAGTRLFDVAQELENRGRRLCRHCQELCPVCRSGE